MTITDLIPWRRGENKVPVRREQDQPTQTLQRDMNQLFNEFFRMSGLAPFRAFDEAWDAFSPRVDIVEGAEEIKVSAELPGMEAKDIDVSLSNDVLTISGEKRQEEEHKGRNYYRMERSYGSFQRSVSVPCEVDADKIDATFNKGVLTITLPKTADARDCKRIAVRAR